MSSSEELLYYINGSTFPTSTLPLYTNYENYSGTTMGHNVSYTNYTNATNENAYFHNLSLPIKKDFVFDRSDVRILFITLYSLVFCCCFFGK